MNRAFAQVQLTKEKTNGKHNFVPLTNIHVGKFIDALQFKQKKKKNLKTQHSKLNDSFEMFKT